MITLIQYIYILGVLYATYVIFDYNINALNGKWQIALPMSVVLAFFWPLIIPIVYMQLTRRKHVEDRSN